MATTQGQVFKAFQERYAAAHGEQFGIYPDAHNTEAAYRRIIRPILTQVVAGWPNLSEGRRALFMKTAVYEALKGETGTQS